MSVASATFEQVLEARTLPLRTVTIFRDRAELRRVFDVTLRQGLNNIRVDNVCASIVQDSIRVDGKGSAIIHEVNFKSERATADEINTPQVKEMAKKLEDLEWKKDSLKDLGRVYEKRLESMNSLVGKIGQITVSDKSSSELLKFDDNAEQTLEKLYSYHERKAVELNAKIRQAALDIKELDAQIAKIPGQLTQLRYDVPVKRSICIALEATADDSKTEIELTYQVYNAYWNSSYDIRVNTTEKEALLKLIYYGNIQQNTGEDWTDVTLILSTAQPRVSGQLPRIGTLQAQLVKSLLGTEQRVTRSSGPHSISLFGSQINRASEESIAYDAEPVAPVCLKTVEYKAESHVLSTTFTVPQQKCIPSDGSEHKVTIATLDLKPILHFDCVPSKNTNVYLTASMINTSSYPLLAGQASVYVDNSFSAKINLKAVPTGDRFDCSLGVDPTINVQYKPLHKYQQVTGVLSRSSVTINEQKIVIKNTKQEEPIILTFVEHFPKSTDEKIKIKLHSPELKSTSTHGHNTISTTEDLLKLKAPEAGTKLNDAHNLEWTVVLNPMEEKEFIVKYGVEVPPVETVEFVERF